MKAVSKEFTKIISNLEGDVWKQINETYFEQNDKFQSIC